MKIKERLEFINEIINNNEISLVINKLKDNLLNSFDDENININYILDELKKYENNDIINKFIELEKKLYKINFDLGVKDFLYESIKENIFNANPLIKRFIVNSLSILNRLPEYMIIESVIFEFNKYKQIINNFNTIKEKYDYLCESYENNKNLINLFIKIKELEYSQSNKYYNFFKRDLFEYLLFSDEYSKEKLINNIKKYSLDEYVSQIYNYLKVSFLNEENNLEKLINNKATKILDVYSPIFIDNDKNEYFRISSLYFKKKENKIENINILNYKENIPDWFIIISDFINKNNVKIENYKISIYLHDKKIDLLKNENDDLIILLNDKIYDRSSFSRYFMNEGIFRNDYVNILNNILLTYDYFDYIVNLDFVKRLQSKTDQGKYIDLIFLNNNKCSLIINNTSLNIVNYYDNLSFTQAREEILKYLNYDISQTFRNLIEKEEKEIKEYEEKINEINNSIKEIEESIIYIEEEIKTNNELKYNSKIKNILNLLNEKLNELNDNKNKLLVKIKNIKENIIPVKQIYLYENEKDQDEIKPIKPKEYKTIEKESKKPTKLQINDKVMFKNNKLGKILSILPDKIIVATNDGKIVDVPIEKISELEIIEKSSSTEGGEKINKVDNLRIVESEKMENDEWVEAKVYKNGVWNKCLIKAIEYTSASENDQITVKINNKEYLFPKKNIKIEI